MAAPIKVQDIPLLGTPIDNGDKLLGERVDGETRRIEFQMDISKDASPTLGGNLALNTFSIGPVTATQIGYLQNITSDVQAQIDAGKTTLGIVTTGTWEADTIEVPYGGSGRTSATAYALVAGGTTSTDPHQSLATGSTGQILQSAGASALPTYSTAVFASTYGASTLLYSNGADNVAGLATANNGTLVTDGSGVPSISSTLPSAVQGNITSVGTIASGVWNGTDIDVADGGTGRSSHTAYAVICGGTTSTAAQQSIASVGAAGEVLTSNGAGALPTFQAVPANTAATQADQETATSTTTFVSPGRQQYHPSAAKLWIKFTSITTTTNLASYNVSSLTDGGVGLTTINFTVSFSSTNYGFVSGPGDLGTGYVQALSYAVGSVNVRANNASGSAVDGIQHVAIFGDQ